MPKDDTAKRHFKRRVYSIQKNFQRRDFYIQRMDFHNSYSAQNEKLKVWDF
jgi:hypothetical protein